MSLLFIVILLCWWRGVISEPSDSERLSLAALAVRNLMSPTVVITAGLMIRNVEGGQEADRSVFIRKDIAPL